MSNPTVWRYFVRGKETGCWAVIFLDSHGVFSAHSDFGAFSHHWPAHGKDDFRKFFLPDAKGRLDLDYFARKFGAGRKTELIEEGMREDVVRHVLRQRRDGGYTKEEARREYDLAQEYLGYHFTPESWFSETATDDAAEFFHYDYDWDVKNFIHMILPALSEAIRIELEQESLVMK